jgi:import inner membrane translocase subunit TIM21
MSAIFRHVVVAKCGNVTVVTPTSGSTMNVTNLRVLVQTRCLSRLSCPRAIFRVVGARRTYATYRGMDFGERSQLLAESLDTRQRSEAKQDQVGPFQLGLSPSALRKGEKVQKWSELSTGGKGTHCLKHHENY